MYHAYAVFEDFAQNMDIRISRLSTLGEYTIKKHGKFVFDNEYFNEVGVKTTIVKGDFQIDLTYDGTILDKEDGSERYNMFLRIVSSKADATRRYQNDFFAFCDWLAKEFRCEIIDKSNQMQMYELL